MLLYKLRKGRRMAVTSVDVDRELIAEIKRLTGLKTDREVIHEALKKHRALASQGEFLSRMKSRVFTDDQLSDQTIHYSE
jgi:Arc/MetJ family transcription regulator